VGYALGAVVVPGRNLKALELGSGAGTVSTASTNFEADSTTSEGVTLPASVNIGDTWTQIVDINGHMQMPDNTSAAARNQASQNCNALAQESVSVPAGTFEAMKVECQVEMTITISVQGLDVPPTTLASTSTLWYAEGVGLVKQSLPASLAPDPGLTVPASCASGKPARREWRIWAKETEALRNESRDGRGRPFTPEMGVSRKSFRR
jgi:hypothetical protein